MGGVFACKSDEITSPLYNTAGAAMQTVMLPDLSDILSVTVFLRNSPSPRFTVKQDICYEDVQQHSFAVYPVYCLESLSKRLWNVRVLDTLLSLHPGPIVSISSKCLSLVIGRPVHIKVFCTWLQIVNEIFVASIRDYIITYRSDFLIFSSFCLILSSFSPRSPPPFFAD